MFDFLNSPCRTGIGNSNAAQNAFQPQKTQEQEIMDLMSKEIQNLQKIVNAMCKVYVAENAKEIQGRDPDEKWFRTDQPIIDRAKQLELERQILVAQMELDQLKKKKGVL